MHEWLSLGMWIDVRMRLHAFYWQACSTQMLYEIFEKVWEEVNIIESY